jgi:hypothetical protein
MYQNQSLSTVTELMNEFATQTGLLTNTNLPRRYLWTDAFAVCNFLGLYTQTGEEKYRNLALMLVNQVHNTLGRHRDDDSRMGWISGLDEKEGKAHPAMGGLRIGKKMNERNPSAQFDERLEWDRDGQYYHYLTKWMHALYQLSRITNDISYNVWAIELAKTVHARFTYVPSPGSPKLMYWKMSIDLSRPLVQSMGQHDPLDGLIIYNQLQMLLQDYPDIPQHLDLSYEIAEITDICRGKNWATDDPLGIGSLLCDAYKVAQMILRGFFKQTDLLVTMLGSALQGLESFDRMNPMKLPVDYRLAFRELGLSIGLRAVVMLQKLVEENPDLFNEMYTLHTCIESLTEFARLIENIESFWLKTSNRESENWIDHIDINRVMLATSIAPDGYLKI